MPPANSASKTSLETAAQTREIPNTGGRLLRRRSPSSAATTSTGPMHTNDAFAICENPQLGRNAGDPVEVSAAAATRLVLDQRNPPLRLEAAAARRQLRRHRTRPTRRRCTPPATNAKLPNIAEPTFKYKGQVRICLSGGTMTVGRRHQTCEGEQRLLGPLPRQRRRLRRTATPAPALYSPFNVTYPETSDMRQRLRPRHLLAAS